MARTRPRVLVIDDGVRYAQAMRAGMPELSLVDPGPHGADGRLPDGPAALAFLQAQPDAADVVLLDVQFDVADDRLLPLQAGAPPKRTRRFQGLAILRELRRRWPHLPVVLLTAQEDLSLDEAASDVSAASLTYFDDASDLDTLRIRIFAALQEAALGLEDAGVLWGRDPALRTLRRRLAVLARGTLPVVIEGETGTGKTHLARHFVHANSARSGPFLAVDLATLPTELVPAMLFGAVRGAYTGAVADRKGAFEAAHKGTLLLDEIQNVPLEIQKQLLRVLQEGRVQPVGSVRDVPVDVKVVVASNLPLAELVADGKLRQDLYMRLSPATRVVVPPLRDRGDDLPWLVRRLVAQTVERPDIAQLAEEVARALGLPRGVEVAARLGPDLRTRPQPGVLELALPPAAWQALKGYRWPGNFRELAMVVQNLVSFTLFAAVEAVRSGLSLHETRLQIDAALVHQLLAPAVQPGKTKPETPQDDALAVRVAAGPSLASVASSVERQYLLALFRRTNGDFAAMAERLLGDAGRARAVRLRFNQLGLKARELRDGG